MNTRKLLPLAAALMVVTTLGPGAFVAYTVSEAQARVACGLPLTRLQAAIVRPMASSLRAPTACTLAPSKAAHRPKAKALKVHPDGVGDLDAGTVVAQAVPEVPATELFTGPSLVAPYTPQAWPTGADVAVTRPTGANTGQTAPGMFYWWPFGRNPEPTSVPVPGGLALVAVGVLVSGLVRRVS